MVYGSMADSRGGWVRYSWRDESGLRHRSLSRPPRRVRGWAAGLGGVVRTVGKAVVVTGVVVAVLVVLGVV